MKRERRGKEVDHQNCKVKREGERGEKKKRRREGGERKGRWK